MPPQKPPDEPGEGEETPRPRRASAVKRRSPQDGPITPTGNRRVSAGQTPRSAPAAAGRPKMTPKKGEPPTLLNDFFLGRQSAARVAAVKDRRKSVDAAREVARREMQEGAVRKLQQPGGVKDRVKTWQRANAAAMARGDPNDAASEPTEIWAKDDVESVTEEDRMRIKFRKKARTPRKSGDSPDSSKENHANSAEKKADAAPDDPRLRAPPKKRIVSDNNWMKRRNAQSPAVNNGNNEGSSADSSVNSKVESWASKVEIPANAAGKTPRANRTSPAHTKTQLMDDGIRVKAVDQPSTPRQAPRPPPGKRKEAPADDGIRVKPSDTIMDDGIRVQPLTGNTRSHAEDQSGAEGGSSRPIRRSDESMIPQTPTRTKAEADRKKLRSVSASHVTDAMTAATSDDESTCSDATATSRARSDRGAKSLASIPFGYSAFSELDLPVGADAYNTKRPKAQRNNSFKAVPAVFKKVVSEGKKIIQEKVDQPKPTVNKPPSIESWLHNTVDPFVESPTPPKRKSVEKEWERESRKRSSSDARPADLHDIPHVGDSGDGQDVHKGEADLEKTPTKISPENTSSAGLRRSRATRETPSSAKSGGRKAFRDALKSAFKGESAGVRLPSMTYQNKEFPRGNENDGDDGKIGGQSRRRRSSGSDEEVPSSQEPARQQEEHDLPPTPTLKRRPPPTNGFHELSTIASEASYSTHGSDVTSRISQTTITQNTDLSRQKSSKSGLKRRLTKHSDLVSALSLPDNATLPQRRGTVKHSSGLHRRTSKIGRATIEDILDEFQVDEDLYQRELKTLVDGVIPVLLTQAVNSSTRASDLFDTNQGETSQQADALGKAVVDMGIALEKLRNYHKRMPPLETNRMLSWLDSLYPIYNNYLDVWRLGFQGVMVTLAPSRDKPEDEDSLLNAMPRNEHGDVLDDDGHRVDVAYLLKRPVVRIKWLLKFVRGALMILGSTQAAALLVKYEKLVDKARERHRQELARATDEEAITTDVTRARHIRTLAPKDHVQINVTRQVNAKDPFSLELAHSSGQRLECEVEMIFRDNTRDTTDAGDVLIREVEKRGTSWLLFEPLAPSQLSARQGSLPTELVVMVRGTERGREWYELLNLRTDHEDQVQDWLHLLGSQPWPPELRSRRATAESKLASDPTEVANEVPVGEKKPRAKLSKPQPIRTASDPSSPSVTVKPDTQNAQLQSAPRHARTQSAPVSPRQELSSSVDKTPTQASHAQMQKTHPLPQVPQETRPKSPERAKLTKPRPTSSPAYRDDGAPPPPAHRTLSPKPTTPLASPPVELSSSARVKRRTSSPLKHEYRPSITSSDSSDTVPDGSDSESASDDEDELDEADVPDLAPGFSLKQSAAGPAASEISDSSLTPSNSASQAGLASPVKNAPAYSIKIIAIVSYWSNRRGMWREVSTEACSAVITPGFIDVYPLNSAHSLDEDGGLLTSTGTSDIGKREGQEPQPLVALDLTPHVMLRQSTLVDIEIRSPIKPHSLLKVDSAIWRFRAPSPGECSNLYMAVHRSRLDNAKYKAIEEENRIRAFGQMQQRSNDGSGDGSSSSRRRGWFGRRSSYRASTRAPSNSQGGSSSGVSASSFLKKLTGSNSSYNIANSSVDRENRTGSNSGGGSLYTSGSSSAGGTSSPRSPSVADSTSKSRFSFSSFGGGGPIALDANNLKIRCHLLVTPSKWEDKGNCILQITRPPPGMRQELAVHTGMPKRVIVKNVPKKEGAKPEILLDAVLGSICFGKLGTRGIVLNVWEEVRDEGGAVGMVPAAGGAGGKLKKWCFQCGSTGEAAWIWGLVTSEVVIA